MQDDDHKSLDAMYKPTVLCMSGKCVEMRIQAGVNHLILYSIINLPSMCANAANHMLFETGGELPTISTRSLTSRVMQDDWTASIHADV